MREDESDPHKGIPIYFNSYLTLRDHYDNLSHLPSGNYHVVIRSKTKTKGNEIPMVWRVDKAVNPLLKCETQVKGEGIPNPIPVIPDSSKPQRIIQPSLPRKGQGRAGVRGKLVAPKVQPIWQPQPKNTTPHEVHFNLEPPITIPSNSTKSTSRKPPFRPFQ